jgi:hypothetical protein
MIGRELRSDLSKGRLWLLLTPTSPDEGILVGEYQGPACVQHIGPDG